MSFETLARPASSRGELNTTACAACWGTPSPPRRRVAPRHLEKVYAVEHALLKDYTPDAYTIALRQLLELAKPSVVLFPDSYQVLDFLPKLAASLGKAAVRGAISHASSTGSLV